MSGESRSIYQPSGVFLSIEYWSTDRPQSVEVALVCVGSVLVNGQSSISKVLVMYW